MNTRKLLATASLGLGLLAAPAHAINPEAVGIWRVTVLDLTTPVIWGYICQATINAGGRVRGVCSGGAKLTGKIRVNQWGLTNGRLRLDGVGLVNRLDIAVSDNSLTGIAFHRGRAGFLQLNGVRVR